MTPSRRPSPPTDRVVQLIDHLAAHPRAQYTLAELVRSTGMSQATCLAVATTLVGAGYLVRDEADRTYGLGPALVAIGRAAEDALPDLDGVRRTMAELSDALDVVCTVSTVVEQRIAVLDRTGRSAQLDDLLRPGQRYPFRPPLGLMFAAWDTDDAVRQWLDRTSDRRLAPDEAGLWDAVTRCRQRGYLIERLSSTALKLQRAIVELPDEALPPHVTDLLGEIALALAGQGFAAADTPAEPTGSVTLIGAPVFDRHGRPRLVLMLYVLRDEHPEADEAAMATRLRAAADALTGARGGADPWRAGDR